MKTLRRLLRTVRQFVKPTRLPRPLEALAFQRVRVIGHRRCGTHYVASLIDSNFFDGSDHLRHYAKHKWPEQVDLEDDTVAYVFVWRDFAAIAKSIFRMRTRFGLQVDDFDTFLATRYSDMWSAAGHSASAATFSTAKGTTVTTMPGRGLSRITMTPRELWESYNRAWLEQSGRPNVIVIPYECLTNNFDFAMLYLATRLGSRRRQFANIADKVGWSGSDTADHQRAPLESGGSSPAS